MNIISVTYTSTWMDVCLQLTALDAEGRAVLTEHICGEEEGGRVVVVNVYCPRVDSDNSSRLDYKLRFYAALQERCTALERAGK